MFVPNFVALGLAVCPVERQHTHTKRHTHSPLLLVEDKYIRSSPFCPVPCESPCALSVHLYRTPAVNTLLNLICQGQRWHATGGTRDAVLPVGENYRTGYSNS
ncbi:hypothetical protein AVEN_49970-1 [Araneus ventricosus]|uniref:Uncharacterized protein n=1 Tax=Araneus ventricosus TaxID=182803 RepID=A0A4Y2NCC2_ARAVE|nr:hypothetical protein AVEN_49970-1 [Araneus ventricosus]